MFDQCHVSSELFAFLIFFDYFDSGVADTLLLQPPCVKVLDREMHSVILQ